MKKFVRNTIGAFMALSLVAGAISCSDGLDESDPFVEAGVVNKPTNSSSSGSGSSGNGGSGSGVAATGSFDMPENEWDKGNLQYKGSTGIASLDVGDKVTMTFKGKASRAFKGEFFIVDTTPTAGPNGYWGELAEKYVLDVPAEFNITHTFEITQKPWGTGDESTYFAVVGKGETETIHIDYTELKFVKNGEEGSGEQGGESGSGQEQGGEGGQSATVVKTLNLTVNHYDDADHGIQYTEDMSAIPVDAKKDDVWTLKIAGTADAEFRGDMQFVNASWGGITGESISKTFTTTPFSFEIDFSFSADCSDGKFMLGNAGMDPAVAKTLSLTEYSFTKKSPVAPGGDSESAAETVAKKIKLVKNEYAEGGAAQTQVKIATGCDSLAVGDKVKLTIKGTADKALGHAEMMVVDTTKVANWWTMLSEKYEVEIGATFEVSYEFTIAVAPVGTGSESMMLAINGLDGDETVNLSCTEFKIEKVAGTESTEPAPQTDPEETPAAADTTIWTGEAELDWEKGDASGDVINKDKFAGKTFVGLKFTISSFVQDATTIRIMAQDDWSDITPFESAEGDCMIANSGDAEGKALWVWGTSATVKFSASNIERITNNGIKFYGTGVTITKVELVTE